MAVAFSVYILTSVSETWNGYWKNDNQNEMLGRGGGYFGNIAKLLKFVTIMHVLFFFYLSSQYI